MNQITDNISLNISDTPYQTQTRAVSFEEACFHTALAGLLARVDSYLLTKEEILENAWEYATKAKLAAHKKGVYIP